MARKSMSSCSLWKRKERGGGGGGGGVDCDRHEERWGRRHGEVVHERVERNRGGPR